MNKTVSPSVQARRDKEKSKLQPVKTLADMSPEEQAEVFAKIEASNRDRAKRQAAQAQRGY